MAVFKAQPLPHGYQRSNDILGQAVDVPNEVADKFSLRVVVYLVWRPDLLDRAVIEDRDPV